MNKNTPKINGSPPEIPPPNLYGYAPVIIANVILRHNMQGQLIAWLP